MEGGTGMHDQVFCLVESQMVIFNFEEAGDWNRATSMRHSSINVYILYRATSLPSFSGIASLLAEIFLIFCLTTVLAIAGSHVTSLNFKLHNY